MGHIQGGDTSHQEWQDFGEETMTIPLANMHFGPVFVDFANRIIEIQHDSKTFQIKLGSAKIKHFVEQPRTYADKEFALDSTLQTQNEANMAEVEESHREQEVCQEQCYEKRSNPEETLSLPEGYSTPESQETIEHLDYATKSVFNTMSSQYRKKVKNSDEEDVTKKVPTDESQDILRTLSYRVLDIQDMLEEMKQLKDVPLHPLQDSHHPLHKLERRRVASEDIVRFIADARVRNNGRYVVTRPIHYGDEEDSLTALCKMDEAGLREEEVALWGFYPETREVCFIMRKQRRYRRYWQPRRFYQEEEYYWRPR